ncbi:hypothetical protein JCM11491_003849 [Sporobolomyces phaffii]
MQGFDWSALLADQPDLDQQVFDPGSFVGLPVPFPADERFIGLSPTTTASPTLSAPVDGPSPAGPEVPEGDKKLRNCAACRMRRVKCEREPGQTSCIKCIAKGLVCTQLPTKPRKTPVRTGKRLESAQALFGQPDPVKATGDDRSVLPPPTKRRRDERSVTVSLELSPTSVVGKLVTGELEASLTGSLLELYDTMPRDGRIPLFQATVFRPAFERGGRRLDGLDPKIEPLAAVVLALAARVSDHPLLVGASAPGPTALAQLIRDGHDLSGWGQRRTDACQALLDRAVQVADERGVWRDPSPENFATLMMIEGMTDYENAHEPRRPHPTRTIGAAYMLHLRAILLDSDAATKERVMGSGVGWTAFCRDSILSATTGSTSVFSDDDCFLLSENMPIPLDKALAWPEVDSRNPENPYECPFWILFNSVMYTIASLGRSAAVKLTGLRATRNPRVNEEFVRFYLSTLRKLKIGFDSLEPRLARYLGPEEGAVPEVKVVHGFVKHLRATKAGLAFLLDRVLKQRKSTKEASVASEAAKIFQLEEYGPLGGPARDEDGEYWDRFETLLREGSDIAFDAGRELVGLFRMQESLSLGTISGMQMLFVRLPMWVSRLIDAPTAEEGGSRAEWTFDSKLEDLRTVLRAVHRIGWSYASYARPAPWLKGIIARIEAKQQQHLLALGTDVSFPFSPIDSTYVTSASSSTPPTSAEFASGLPWSFDPATAADSDIPVTTTTNAADWETLLQSIVDSTSLASTTTAPEQSVEPQREGVLVEMFQNLLS